jgi:hypothetical protein
MEKEKLPAPQFKVGVTSGLWVGGEAMDTASVVRKVGYALTRGAGVIEIGTNVPHETTYTDGKEIRYVAKSQGLEITYHGSLTVPYCVGDRESYNEAQDVMRKSVKSAVFSGASYVNFHASLWPWPELITYAETKLRFVMVDWNGRHIKELLKEKEKLRKWFIQRYGREYGGIILKPEVALAIESRAREAGRRKIAEMIDELRSEQEELEKRIREEKRKPTEAEIKRMVEIGKKIRELTEKGIDTETFEKEYAKLLEEELEKHLSKGLPWQREEWGNDNDITRIVAHYLFFYQDPIWKEMLEAYPQIEEKFGPINYEVPKDEEEKSWLEIAFERADKEGGRISRIFKEFYYGMVAMKYFEGHMIKLFKEFIGEELPEEIEKSEIIPKEDKQELKKILENLKVTIEVPDARDPRYAGMYRIWRPIQIYIIVKIVREEFKKDKKTKKFADRIFMLLDFEHIATQGVDPLEEIKFLVAKVPDVGKYILSCHVTTPNPLHTHLPLQMGDTYVYRILYELRKAGLGKHHTTYLIFERGGFRDPFQQSVRVLKLMTSYLERDVEVKLLPPEYFGLPSSPDFARQRVVIFEHALDPLKGVLAVPEEQYTYMGKAALEKGKRPEEWKKEELR